MRTSLVSYCVIATIQALAFAPAARTYITDGAPHPPPQYRTLTPPPAGSSFLDPVFGTEIRRISDALSTTDGTDGGRLTFVMNEYATMSAFNQDLTRLVLQHDSYFGLYDGSGRFLRDLPFEVHAGSEPRWSRADSSTLYYLSGNQVKSLDVDTGETAVVHSFSEYTYVSGRGESTLCFDGQHMVLVGDDRYVFVYDIATDTKGSALDAGSSFDAVYITPDDHVTITWHASGQGRQRGIELFDREMRFLRQVARAGGHMDVTRDDNGDEVLIWTNSADPAPICDNGLVKIRLSDGEQTCLHTLDWSLAVHVSCPDGDGTCLIGTYAPSDPDPAGLWPAYTDELFQVLLDGSGTRRLAHYRSRPFNGYNYMPRASVSRDGSRAVFSSNFGLQEIAGAPAEYSDAYWMALSGGAGSAGGDDSGGGDDTGGGGETGGGEGGNGDGGGGDPAGGASGGDAISRFEEDSAEVALSGSWHANHMGLHSGGGAILAQDAGARATFSFQGTGVRWIGYRDEWSGIARVHVDGRVIQTVDTSASPQQAQWALFTVTGLVDGPHTLEIEVTGTFGAASTAAWIWVDAFEAIAGSAGSGGSAGASGSGGTGTGTGAGGGGAAGLGRVEQGDASVTLTGSWFPNEGASHSGGSALLAMDPGSRAELSFRGTGVRWIGHRDDWSGVARVFVDGALAKTVDTWASTDQAQATVFAVEGLADTDHTLVIEVVGEVGPASSGAWIWIDAFEVTQGAKRWVRRDQRASLPRRD